MTYFDDFHLLNVMRVTSYGGDFVTPDRTQYEYLGVISGCIQLNSSGGLYWNERPFVYFTPSGVPRLRGWRSPPGRSRDNFYLEFTGERAHRIMDALKRDFPCARTGEKRLIFIDNPDPYRAILEEIRTAFNRGDARYNHRVALLTEEFVALMYEQRLCDSCGGNRYGIKLSGLMEEINAAPGADFDFKHIAGTWNLSYDHFRKLFTAHSGKAPHEYLLAARLRLALRILAGGGRAAVKQVAAECGFSGASEFTRFFKKNTGTTPAQYQWLRKTM